MRGPFQSLLDLHEDFADLLLSHQASLVRGDLAQARLEIESLATQIDAHARHEETKILPVLERAGGWSRIGDPRFYREEHAKLRAMLADLVARTRALDAGSPQVHRTIARLIGDEQAFRSLLEHHDDRERRALYPDLERLTRPEEWADLIRPPA